MKRAYGIVIEEQDRCAHHIDQLYASMDDARVRRDQELMAIIHTRKLVSSPHLDTTQPNRATLICGMFGFQMFVGRIIEFLVPTDFAIL